MRRDLPAGLEPVSRRFAFGLDRAVMRAPDGPDATGDGTYTFEGKAVVYGEPVTLIDVPKWGLKVTEEIAPGALSEVLAESPDVHFLWGHDLQRAMARTGVEGVGRLDLAESQDGLRAFAKLDPEDPDVRALAVKMRRGLIDQMSFWANIGTEERTETEDAEGNLEVHYVIRSFTELIDVTVTARGVYPTTTATLRSADQALLDRRRADSDSAGGEPDRRAGSDPAGGTTERARALTSLRARARAARVAHPRRDTA
jgi:HK97 family phage prohead protease